MQWLMVGDGRWRRGRRREELMLTDDGTQAGWASGRQEVICVKMKGHVGH